MKLVSTTGTGFGTVLTDDNGTGISHVSSIDVRIRMEEMNVAIVELYLKSLDMQVHPLLGLETLKASAEFHGFELVKKEA
jgi:hypothetical protein